VGDAVISLRSMSPGDIHLLRYRGGPSLSARMWKTWTVASSVWMVDGINLLEHPDSIHRVQRSLLGLPKTTLDVLFSTTMGLLNRVGTAVKRTESYCYESYSRVNWRIAGRQSTMREEFTGIPGSGRLGMNHVQQMWVAFNLAEDDRLQHMQAWQSAKLVASAASPKGVKKLNRADESLRNREDSRRRTAIEQMVNDAFFGEEYEADAGEMVVMVRGEPVVVPRVKTARTADELSEQMRSWVAGEKDWHDIVVDTYKQRVREQFQQEKTRREESRRQLTEPGVTSETLPLVGYTAEQIKDMRPELFDRRAAGTKQVFDNSSRVSLYHKYIADNQPDFGPLRADELGVFVEDDDGENEQGLQREVAGRRPAFSTEPIGPPKVRTTPQKGDG